MVTDGSRIYFVETPFVSSSLMQVSTLGGETSGIDVPFSVDGIGDISPDRSSLLMPSFSTQENLPVLWALPLPAGTPRRLGGLHGYNGTWSPDGQRILYADGHDLFVARTDGTESRKLASLSGFPWWLRWSPDGSRLRISVFDKEQGSDSLWEIQADGNHAHALLPDWNSPSQECCGNWTPDGRYFVFQSTQNGKTQIWAMAEKRGLLRKTRSEPTELTTGAVELFFARCQRGWTETLCHRLSAARGVDTFQSENPTVRALSFGYISGRSGLLQGWAMGDLHLLSRREPMAEQSGWQRAAPTDISSGAGGLASLVS